MVWRPLSAFIIKQGLCFRPPYERRFPRLKVTCLKRDAACCYICSIIKVNIFLSFQCFLILTCTSSELLSCSSATYPTPRAAPIEQPSTQRASIHLPECIVCTWSAGRRRKKKNQPLKHPPRTSTTQELRVELQIELIQWLRLS